MLMQEYMLDEKDKGHKPRLSLKGRGKTANKQQILTSDEGLTLETSAFQSLYGGQFTLSTTLIKQNFRVKIR